MIDLGGVLVRLTRNTGTLSLWTGRTMFFLDVCISAFILHMIGDESSSSTHESSSPFTRYPSRQLWPKSEAHNLGYGRLPKSIHTIRCWPSEQSMSLRIPALLVITWYFGSELKALQTRTMVCQILGAESLFVLNNLYSKVQQKGQIQWQKISWSCVMAISQNKKRFFKPD